MGKMNEPLSHENVLDTHLAHEVGVLPRWKTTFTSIDREYTARATIDTNPRERKIPMHSMRPNGTRFFTK